ncbi:Ubiquitin conjugation factor E4 A [Gryllus bimaculatus]|nr:Ubiquitin conjugation factor E4 A [Gryllus bimaculatus]
MRDNLENNPFSALFPSVNDTEKFTRIIQSSGQIPLGTSNVVARNKSVQEASSVSPEVKCDSEIDEIVKRVFHLTLKNEPIPSCQLVYLEDLATALAPEDSIDINNLGQALFERLLLEDPSKHLVIHPPQESSHLDGHVIQKNVITYLFECYKRLYERKSSAKNKDLPCIDQGIGLIYQNAATALRQCELFENQSLHLQILELFADENVTNHNLSYFFEGIIKEFIKEDGEIEVINSLLNAFQLTLDVIHKDFASRSLLSYNGSYFRFLHLFSANKYLGQVLLKHSAPKNPQLGNSFADTLIGAILCLSCLPKSQNGLFEYFDKPLQQTPSIVEGNIWSSTQNICENLHKIFYNLLKCSSEVRHQTLNWIGECLHSNAARGKIWSSHVFHIGSPACVSDGFILNLSSVLLHLCQPFCSDLKDVKLLKIDPTYCAVNVNSDEESRKKGVHLKKIATETCLIPAPENLSRPTADCYGFVSECFFLAHRALDLGFRVIFERLMRLNQDLARMQRAFNDAQSQAGAQSELVQAIGERMEMEMSRYLSFRAALLEPTSLQMMSQLHVATAVWLVQVTLNTDIQVPMSSYAPMKFKEMSFPLPEEIPITLSCIPEFIIENTACFLSFVRRFNPRNLEEEGFNFLNPLLTEVLVFMGSPQRMKNPHLRARMAECLESLLPHHNEEQPMLNPNPLGCYFRERLFKEHPFRKQIILSLLDVFVGIEMTGQSVAFEQKFNYRRPMYIVMDYLWQIEDHRKCFKILATEAEANMEAVTPPLFLRFINLLMNDAVFLLDDALSNMAQLRQMQAAREAGEWENLPPQERDQNEGFLQHTGMIARFDNILGRETIHTLEFLTSEITSIFCHPTMVDRIASMLNYFLYHLVGPNKKNFKVKDQKEYEFNPAGIVMDICKIYVHLYKSRIGGGSLIADLQAVAAKVADLASQQQTEEEILAEAPDEFLDPIMSTVMVDPVILPSSRKTVDRSTIARHLLSDQTDPFNRSPLTMDMVTPNSELLSQIQTWIKEKKQQARNSSDSQD